ncbi:hypothetical protein, partial [Burkholderia ubonensis]|uniref:hypothetical protein n=1 Tax=Burkholderia ubonensis TaxID=101571 RepID=UPI001E65A143
SPATSRDPVSDRPMCVSISSTHYLMTMTILSESLVRRLTYSAILDALVSKNLRKLSERAKPPLLSFDRPK